MHHNILRWISVRFAILLALVSVVWALFYVSVWVFVAIALCMLCLFSARFRAVILALIAIAALILFRANPGLF